MTGILLACVTVLGLAGALYVLLCRPHLVTACWYRMFHDPDPYDSCFATVPDEAPTRDPVDEHFKTAPRVVAGQDIDDSKLIAELQQAYADYRAGRDIFAGAPREI